MQPLNWDTGSAFKIAAKANSILLHPILSRPTYTFQYSGQKQKEYENSSVLIEVKQKQN